ncbi:MAG: 4-hydroxy-tetrahydrodipicolinate reductase, partial [Deltaproteobacteria bacterium]|nr:4-hydroxy-tetrahydrodipicolinate reductase [Deltaproteobacteria bacterium]
MSNLHSIIICGISGRMGTRIADLIQSNLETTLAGGVGNPNSPHIGKPLFNAPCVGSLQDIISSGDSIIDFSQPQATLQNLEIAVQHQKPLVIGTTGFTSEERKKIEEASKKIPICFSSNMSIGVNVMWKLLKDAVKALGNDFDIEVLEMHHRLKKDAPSGTAMTTAEVLAEAAGRDLSKVAVYERKGMTGERRPEEIGIQTLRGGDVVGDHTVFFAGTGERLEITHRA